MHTNQNSRPPMRLPGAQAPAQAPAVVPQAPAVVPQAPAVVPQAAGYVNNLAPLNSRVQEAGKGGPRLNARERRALRDAPGLGPDRYQAAGIRPPYRSLT